MAMETECKGFEVIHMELEGEALISYFLETFEDEYAPYGIYVEKEVDNILVETEHTGGFMDDKDVAEEIIMLMIRNRITPCVLNEVVYDYLTERISG